MEQEKANKEILSVEEIKKISENFISSYKRNCIMYAHMILSSNATKSGKAKNSGSSESDMEQFFFQIIKISTGFTKEQLSTMKLPPNHVILCDEKFACIWAQYVFLVVTNPHPRYTPKAITLEVHTGTQEIPVQTVFAGFSKNCRQVSQELEENARDLLEIVSNDTTGINISAGILHYMLAFSKWMIIMDDVKQHKKYETFVSDITEWCNLKRRAEVFITLDEQEFQANQTWAGCAEWLASMDCFVTSKGQKLVCRNLFDSLQTLPRRERKKKTSK